jgi:tetratricopeptide (TPR) repeat protein
MTQTSRPDAILQEISRLQAGGNVPQAEHLARRLVAEYPDAPAALNALAVVLAGREAFAEAERFAEAAVARAPGEAVFQGVLGRIRYRNGNLAGAAEAYRQATLLRPDHAEAFHNLGIVHAAQGRAEDALAAQRRALIVDPRCLPAGMEAAALLRRQGHDAEALNLYEQVIATAPGHVPAHREYTDLAWSLGHDIRDLKTYAFARAQIGDRPDLLLAEAEMRLRLNQPTQAETLLANAQRHAPRDDGIANALARALALLGKTEDARDQFERAIAAAPGVAAHRQDFAAFLLNNRDFDAARHVLKQALRLAPRNQSNLACLALAERALGHPSWRQLMDIELVQEIHLPVPPGFADAASFHAALTEELMARHAHRVAPLDQTLRGGTQTVGSLFTAPTRAVGLLRDAITRAVEEYVTALPRDAAHPFLSRVGDGFDFAGSWSSCLAPGGFHTNHVHPAGWISSAYYVALPEGDEGALQFGQSQFLLGQDDRPMRVVKPEIGTLVLFPSYFWHGTVPFRSGGRRLTVAFDAVPKNPRPS